MRHFTFLLLSVAFLSGASCAAQKASNSDTLPQENLGQCRSLCSSVGMELTSLVVVTNQTGCVCEFPNQGAKAAAVGGAVTVMLQSQRQQQQQQNANARN